MSNAQVSDISQSFLFQDHPIKGLYISLDKTYLDILACHNTKGHQATLLGEAMLAACCLLQPMKINGTLTVQFQSHDSVKMLVVKANTSGELRGLINSEETLAEPLLGQGYLVVTVQQTDTPTHHQSLIEVSKRQNFAAALTRFFAQSEQLPSLFVFAVDENKACGMMLQRMPNADNDEDTTGKNNETWNEVSHLFCTLKMTELLQLPPTELLHRLFHEHNVQLFEPNPLRFCCHCDREKMSHAIMTLGREDAIDFFSDHKMMEVTCEYCKAHYAYSQLDVKLLFESKSAQRH